MIASIRHNLRRLFDFSGRETRALFWPYALVLFVASMILNLLIIVPVVVDMLVRIRDYLIKHPEGLPPGDYGQPGQPPLPPELMPDFSGMIVPMGILNLVLVLLVAAAVARRLHDRDMTGLWGLLPLPFMAIGQAMAPQGLAMMTGGSPDPTAFALIGLNSVLNWGALILLVVLLALDGTPGPNRYGPEPAGDR